MMMMWLVRIRRVFICYYNLQTGFSPGMPSSIAAEAVDTKAKSAKDDVASFDIIYIILIKEGREEKR
jgi:hypothetical protein